MPASPRAPDRMARSPIRAPAKLTPASAKAHPRAAAADDRPDRKDFRPRDDRGGDKRPYTPRGDARPAARFPDKKFGDKRPYAPRDGEKRPYTPRGEGFRKDGDRPRGDRPYSCAAAARRRPSSRRSARAENLAATRNFPAARPDRKSDLVIARILAQGAAGDRGPRRFRESPDRGNSKPWQKRDASSPDHAGRNSRPPRDGARNFDKPRYDKPREDRGGDERPRFSRPREDRPQGDRPFRERPKFDRPAKAARIVRNSSVRVRIGGPRRLAGASAQRTAIL